ncbi:MAG: T9SS type A sorting domain-containing protein [Chitinophagales bacterium]|jgi:hypothetical protein|nr:T9SS type A sorting domain-containing protein [Chitinophagales bacterium]HNI45425.1 T9SS type A sorting domain-containing protein [Chitinophagales bacterium]HNL08120.1 T9SS type A sorting domain-containing protein [Chitinophagales bacterium]
MSRISFLFLTLCFLALTQTSYAWGGEIEKTPIISNVSPNPSRAVTTIKINANNTNNNYRLEVYDVIGNPVYTTTNHQNADKSRFVFDVSDWEGGMYFYFVVENDRRVSTGRIIVKH